jgi:signal transduction histidine kinase
MWTFLSSCSLWGALMRNLRDLWRMGREGIGLFTPVATWQKHLLEIFLLATLALSGILTLINLGMWITVPTTREAFYVAGDIATVIVAAGLWRLSRTGRARLVSYIYLLLQVAATVALFSPGSQDRVMLIYAIPILMASFLIGPAAAVPFAVLSILVYTATYLTWNVGIGYNYVAVLILVLLSVIAWLIAHQLQRLMHTVQDEAAAHKEAEEESQRQSAMLAALHETGLELAAQQTLPDLLRAIVSRAAGLLGATRGGIYLYRPASDDLEYVYVYHWNPSLVGTVLRRGEGISGKVLASGRPLAVPDYDRWEGRSPQHAGQGVQSAVAVPIVWGERFLGVINLDADAPRTFSAEDVALLERFAPLAAAALENHRLLGDLQQRMVQLQEAQAQLVQSTKMAAIGNLAAGVAHEVNNPMTIIMGFAEVMVEEAPADSSQRRDLQRILVEARRIRRIIHALLDYSQQTKPHRRPVDVNKMVHSARLMLDEQIPCNGIVVEEAYASDLDPLSLDADQVQQALLNIMTNAVQAMPQGGRLCIGTRRVGAEIAITVTDTGGGMSAELQEHVFDPFFTTNPAERVGLGLSVSLGIVREHGGRIEVQSRKGQGSAFTVWLPQEG